LVIEDETPNLLGVKQGYLISPGCPFCRTCGVLRLPGGFLFAPIFVVTLSKTRRQWRDFLLMN
jgi:hypothetical protein